METVVLSIEQGGGSADFMPLKFEDLFKVLQIIFAGKNPSYYLAHVFLKAKTSKSPSIYAIYTSYFAFKSAIWIIIHNLNLQMKRKINKKNLSLII